MGIRVKQLLVAVLGTAICVTMVALGLWQMRVFESKEDASAELRTQQPPVSLVDNVAMDGTTGDIYGRQVTAAGHYLPDQQELVVDEDGSVRVLTALELADGRVLAVVRGTVASVDVPVPAPPAGEVQLTGVFLATESAADPGRSVPAGTLASVRLAELAQAWPQQLIPGYVTLPAQDARAQGLGAAAVTLPTGSGSIQNIGYALQWWVFAAFGAFMTVRFVRAIGRSGGLGTLSDQEEE
ncbi:MAG: SURF1 family protein [Propionicimonas sp.]|uniref:SURF1 family protein n=1 Tax=Propionicimonas sp. TaxID=1955623 RepID=UPI003D0F9F83